MVAIDYSQLTKAIIDAVPTDVFTWSKTLLIIVVIYFGVLVIKNLIQIGTAWKIRKISNNVEQINNKIDGLITTPNNQSVVTGEEQQYAYT